MKKLPANSGDTKLVSGIPKLAVGDLARSRVQRGDSEREVN